MITGGRTVPDNGQPASIKEMRDELRSGYHSWKSSRKGSNSQISGANPTDEQKDRVKKLIDAERVRLHNIVIFANRIKDRLTEGVNV